MQLTLYLWFFFLGNAPKREMLNLHQRTETGSATTRDNLIRIDSVKFTIYDKRTIFMYSTLNFLIKSVPAQDFY